MGFFSKKEFLKCVSTLFYSSFHFSALVSWMLNGNKKQTYFQVESHLWFDHSISYIKKKERSHLEVLTAKIYWNLDTHTQKETLVFVSMPILLVKLPWWDQKINCKVRCLTKASLYSNYHSFQESPENTEGSQSSAGHKAFFSK